MNNENRFKIDRNKIDEIVRMKMMLFLANI